MAHQFSSGIQCLSLVARFHQLPANSSDLKREFQHDDESLVDINLIRAAKSLGFKAKFIQDKAGKLNAHTLPAIARHQDGHFFIIAKVGLKDGNDEVLIHDLTNNKPTTHSRDELTSFWTGDLLLLSKRSSLIGDALTENAKFGFSWFIPSLIKYKAYFSDVFVASFFTQLVGLASPIFLHTKLIVWM